ncbi:MAG: hypothetical protein M5U01_37465 [Ardenticatenaceae bacterium]|nr:hypothetical protein [Ardenticatenaceae bacterium]
MSISSPFFSLGHGRETGPSGGVLSRQVHDLLEQVLLITHAPVAVSLPALAVN